LFSALVNNVFPGIRLTKSEGRLLPKRWPFLGEKRGSGPLTHPVGEVLAWLLLPKRVFKCQFSSVWKSFCEVGLSQLLCIDWLLAWNVVSSEAGLSSVTCLGAGILVCVFEGHLCFIQSNLWSNLWLRSLCGVPQITEFTVMGYPPLLLSDKISTSYLLPLLALRFLMPQSRDASVRLSFVLRSTSPARPSITLVKVNACVIAYLQICE